MAGACAETRLETLRGKALALFAERGFAQVGMRELALHLGMAAGSLYHHFESKEQLLFELIEELYEELLGAPRRVARGGARERLEQLLQRHIALHERRPAQFQLAEQELRCLTPAHRRRIQGLREAYEERLAHLLLEAGAGGAPARLRFGVQALVTWLNNLPPACPDLPAQQRLEVIGALLLAALDNLLEPAPRQASTRILPLAWPALGAG
ncbi:hypothetical protein N878_07800 [Pseudomonas sp. EGD-AK9]|uniref:TetR/AcrR family transcriptional regulator n=2 Tax=unclassified Pseudomonas TaxID=196821 RepID=UPI00039740F6|nr:TetR/AcrR family transcriptional regulator [Pseudomonas sp. EGD-AK9]ERI50814.1 hypothetical protein N878_07800 [Pseudomonas sp. EGD-AK9]